MVASTLLLALVLDSSSLMQDAVAMVITPRPSCTRRFFIPKIGGTLSSLLIVGNNLHQEARAADESSILIPPPQPIPMAGVGAPLRPVVMDQTENPWQVPSLSTKLGQSRISAQELSPLNPSLSPFADNDLFYPTCFAGEWNVKATLRRKTYPYGLSFVPSRSLVEGSPRYRSESVGDATTYQARYVPLDDGPITQKSKIVSDRRFNSISVTRAYNQLTPVEGVVWDPKKDPTLLKFNFAAGPLTEDMMPIGPRRAEVYITARKKEDGVASNEAGGSIFAASERTRQVTLGAGAVVVSDTETISEYQISDGGDIIHAVQRIAVYLTPNPNSREGILWQQVGGKAIAFFDYDLDMQKTI